MTVTEVSRRALRGRASLAGFGLPLVAGGVTVLALWVVSPRFAITGPSLVDDWNAIASSGDSARGFFHFADPLGVRYRPAWLAWNYVQWHGHSAFGAMFVPNLLGVGRLLILVAGLTGATALLVPASVKPLRRALLSALPAALVVSTPSFALDLARFGPQEPLLLGGMTAGAALLWVCAVRISAGRLGGVTALYALTGVALWVVGVYSKETSVCAFAAIGILVVVKRGQLAVVMRRATRRQHLALGGLAVATVAPLVHVAVETALIVAHGQLVYGARVPSSGSALSLIARAVRDMPSSLGSSVASLLLVFVGVALLVDALRRRLDWVEFALAILAAAALAMSVQSGFFVSRYYMPTVALLAAVAARRIGRLRSRPSWVALSLGLLIAVASISGARSHVAAWAASDEQGVSLARSVHALRAAGCRVAVTGMDDERSLAIEALAPTSDVSGCTRRFLVVGSERNRSRQLISRCGSPSVAGEWVLAQGAEFAKLYRCAA